APRKKKGFSPRRHEGHGDSLRKHNDLCELPCPPVLRGEKGCEISFLCCPKRGRRAIILNRSNLETPFSRRMARGNEHSLSLSELWFFSNWFWRRRRRGLPSPDPNTREWRISPATGRSRAK